MLWFVVAISQLALLETFLLLVEARWQSKIVAISYPPFVTYQGLQKL